MRFEPPCFLGVDVFTPDDPQPDGLDGRDLLGTVSAAALDLNQVAGVTSNLPERGLTELGKWSETLARVFFTGGGSVLVFAQGSRGDHGYRQVVRTWRDQEPPLGSVVASVLTHHLERGFTVQPGPGRRR